MRSPVGVATRGSFKQSEMHEEIVVSDEALEKKWYRITVNGTEKFVEQEVLTFDQVVRLEFPNPIPETIYLVTFEKARQPKEGELLEGQSVEIKNNTEFDVTDSGRS